jgi:hypothetical protein
MLTKKQRIGLERMSNNMDHYDRVDNDTWVVWTSGFETSEMMNIQMFLEAADFMCMRTKFDPICGKTATYFKPLKKEI